MRIKIIALAASLFASRARASGPPQSSRHF
jgi:hypothetical protein